MNYKNLCEKEKNVVDCDKVKMNIVDFNDLLNEVIDSKIDGFAGFEPISNRDILTSGLYSRIILNGKKYDVYVKKGVNEIEFYK